MATEGWSFADESGIEPDQGICIIGGLLATSGSWKVFRAEWEAAVKRFNDVEFHAKLFFNGQDRYRAWPGETRNRYFAELVAIVRSAVRQKALLPDAVAMEHEVFGAFTGRQRRWLTGGGLLVETDETGIRPPRFEFSTDGKPGRAYFVLFQHYMLRIARAAEEGTKIHFVFDNQDQYMPRAIETFDEMRTLALKDNPKYRHVLDTVDYKSSMDEPALQAADMLSYFWRYRLRPMKDHRLDIGVRALLEDQQISVLRTEHLEEALQSLPTEV